MRVWNNERDYKMTKSKSIGLDVAKVHCMMATIATVCRCHDRDLLVYQALHGGGSSAIDKNCDNCSFNYFCMRLPPPDRQ